MRGKMASGMLMQSGNPSQVEETPSFPASERPENPLPHFFGLGSTPSLFPLLLSASLPTIPVS